MAVAFLLLASLLGACLPAPAGGTCRFEDLVQPTNLRPNFRLSPFEDLTPTLSWKYSADCNPEKFQVDVIGPGWASPVHSYRAELDGSSRSVAVGPLQPGTSYYWEVRPISDSREGEFGASFFLTGPACSSADRGAYTPPTLLSPLDGQVISFISEGTIGGVTRRSPLIYFGWENTMTCLPLEGYTVQLSRDRDFSHSDPFDRGSFFTDDLTSTPYFFPEDVAWHDCDRIYWRVLIGSLEGDVYATSVAWSFLINTSGVFCPPDLGPILTTVPWIELPPGPSIPTASLKQPANCRSGPGVDYPALDILPQGLSVPVNGRNQESSWWQVLSPNLNLNCWLAGSVIDLSGDTSKVQIVQVAPPPVAVPSDTPVPMFNCGQYLNQNTCPQAYCLWQNNACVNK